MKITITGKTIIYTALTAAAGYIMYKVIKEEQKKDAEFKAYRDKVLEGRDLETDIQDASYRNEDFDPEDRAKAYEVLKDKERLIYSTKNIADFDKALTHFENLVKDFTRDDLSKDSKIAQLIVFHDGLKKSQRDAEFREQKKMEEEKARIIARSIQDVAKSIKTGKPVDPEKIAKAVTITLK